MSWIEKSFIMCLPRALRAHESTAVTRFSVPLKQVEASKLTDKNGEPHNTCLSLFCTWSFLPDIGIEDCKGCKHNFSDARNKIVPSWKVLSIKNWFRNG